MIHSPAVRSLVLAFSIGAGACGGTSDASSSNPDAAADVQDAVTAEGGGDGAVSDARTDGTVDGATDGGTDTTTGTDAATVDGEGDARDATGDTAAAKPCIDCMNVECSDLHARCVAFKSCPFLECALGCKTLACIRDCDKKFVGGDTQSEALSCMTGRCAPKCTSP